MVPIRCLLHHQHAFQIGILRVDVPASGLCLIPLRASSGCMVSAQDEQMPEMPSRMEQVSLAQIQQVRYSSFESSVA